MSADLIAVLHKAADLTLLYGPDPEGCIRAAVYGRPDVTLPHWDTADSLLVEDAGYWLKRHINPGIADADHQTDIDEWAEGRTVADVRGALYGAADGIEAGAL
ncbi:hypothetical protein ACH492_22410 [Streptomyces sp. NPDC019443]|uniref:hypothetical protein n=1 Tax=Streptomyces sp. NPDC019443 TaxID=3365061 RepID=UPI0037AB8155